MDLRELGRHVAVLRALTPGDAPVVSCYLMVAEGDRGYRSDLNAQVRLLMAPLDARAKLAVWEALGYTEVFLATGLDPATQGVAIFARAGSPRLFLPLQFDVRFPNRVWAGRRPRLEPLTQYASRVRAEVGRSTAGARSSELALPAALTVSHHL